MLDFELNLLDTNANQNYFPLIKIISNRRLIIILVHKEVLLAQKITIVKVDSVLAY